MNVGDINKDVGHAHGEFLGVGEVDTLVGCVSVGLGAQETQSHDESVGVETAKLGEERNGAALAVATVILLVEVLRCIVDDIVEPGLGFLHAPAVAIVVALDLHDAVMRHIGRQLLLHNSGSLVAVHVWREAVAQSQGGLRADHIASTAVVW